MLYQFAESNEELRIADLKIDKSGINKDLSNYSSLPDFDFGVRYTQIGDPNIEGLQHAGEDGLAVSIGLNIPLNRTKNKAIKHQAYLQRQRSIENKKTILNGLKNKIKAVYFKINNAYRQSTLYHKNLIPQAQRAKHIAELHYRENKGSIAQYLETQSTWLNFQLAYQRAVADYWKNLADMEKLTGKSL
jgi:outer membrane protein TolC